MSFSLPYRALNTWNIFSRSHLISDIYAQHHQCIVITKEENIKKYLSFFTESNILSYKIESLYDITHALFETHGIALTSPEIFECITPNFYELTNASSISFEIKKSYDMQEVIKKLSDFWYVYRDFLEGGDYKKLWDILHIRPRAGWPTYSISFWGDEIESLTLFDGKNHISKSSLTLWSRLKIDFFQNSPTKNSGFLDCILKKNPLLILDNVDTYETPSLFDDYKNLISFDLLKIAKKQQFNFKRSDLLIENMSTLREILSETKTQICVFTKNPKPLEKFLLQEDLRNITVSQTSLNILKSYQTPEKKVICDDNLSKIFIKKRHKKSLQENLDLLLQIKSWDYVVHVDHGIGIFFAIIEKEIGTLKKEYLEIHYQDNDKLFVPITEVKRIGKYVGSEHPKLTRLNTKEWSKKLEKVGQDVQIIAEELLEIYAQRKVRLWYAFQRFPQKQHIFQNHFDFDYTPDQSAAIEDILADMEKETPMERILVGDVGFWKTEVAFNAVYNAYLNKKQSLIISPLVVLAYEHYEKACERFAEFWLKIGILTRFEKPDVARKTLADLKNGHLDLVIGTHRLLNENIVYNDLWLLIIDEEHKFWVQDKEAIKKLKGNIDILSMSATPIPRSLNMALNGIKEVSILAHPPKRRLPIETFISKFHDDVIRETGQREFERGWQLYFIHNRVDTIETMQAHLQSLFPKQSIIIAHGQLHGDELENRIIAFKQKRYDILLASTVIENGIDFPNVNTIIINDAYKFGISQIHQLRGRVGRSDKQGYCLLLFSKDKITEDASKRLSTIVEYSHLWAWFELAVKDLEIRWWWDILGIKQSWKASEVGINLYLKMLEEKIEELKNTKLPEESKKIPSRKKIDTTLDLNVEAYIEGHLFENELDKLNFYKEIEMISDFEELQEMIEDFTSENSSLLACNYNLFSLLKVRIRAGEFNIKSIKRIGVSYHIDFEGENTLLDMRRFLDLDREGIFSVIDMQKIKCVVSKFKNDTGFLHYLERILFPAPKPQEKVRKIIKMKK